MSGLSHFDAKGDAHMVDVSDKAVTARIATAEGWVKMAPETFEIITEGRARKGDVIGIAGGYAVATGPLGFNAAGYLKNTLDFLEPLDVLSSLAKGCAFGGLAALMGCYYGMKSERGAQGVGRATKNSVEAAAVLILAANFVLTGIFFSV